MWYTIIFPILVISSLVAIVVFLMKKYSKIKDLAEKDLRNSEKENVEKEILEKKISDGFKQKILLFLEKIIRKLKLFFLRLENLFSVWSESIRKRRNGDREKEISIKEKEIDQEDGEFFLRREKREVSIISQEEEDKKINRKDLFEKILIDRIASNPKDIEAYERLGEYYFEIENWNYSKECFKQVVKLNPRNRNVKARMKELEKIIKA